MGTGTILFVPLMDAYYYLKQAKALNTRVSYRDSSRCIRTSIILTWVALEGAVGYELNKCQKAGYERKLPARLGDKLAFLFSKQETPFNFPEFKERRKIRNLIAHPSDSQTHMMSPLKEAQQTFDYCLGLMRLFYSSHLSLE